MRKLGEDYERQLSPHLYSKAPTVPFFSTVTNEMVSSKGVLDASYWRSNLESPVLFNTGVKELLAKQGLNTVLVEIGPHSALSGPLRQITSQLGAQQVSYVPTLVRNEDESKALLRTAGELFCKGLGIQFAAINPEGRVLTSLPTYPWNRNTKYWYESRISRDFRERGFPHHPILGSRVVETSPLEPIWRNLLRLDSVPWCRDHKIASTVVFPGTGYLAMAGEAMRQISGAQDVTLRQVTIASALVLSSSATEINLSMRPYKLTNTLDSPWHEFTISSYDERSNSWTKHCFGHVRAGSDHPHGKDEGIAHLPRELEPSVWYEAMRAVGLNYGPHFQGLGRLSTDLLQNAAVADLRDTVPEPTREEGAVYYIHPTSSDACLQLLSAASSRGQARSFRRKAVPTYIGEAYFKCPQGTVTVKAEADVMPNGAITGDCTGVDDTKSVVLRLKDVKLTPMDDGDAPPKDPHAGGRVHWKPDIDFQDASQLIHSQKEVREAYYRLQKLVLLCCIAARDELGGIEAQIAQPYLAKFQKWLFEQVAQAERDGYPLLDSAETRALFELAPEERPARIAEYLRLVTETEYATIGRVVYRLHQALGAILRGEADALEILRQDDALVEIYSLGNQWDYGPWLRSLSHRTPHLRVLEIGAGTGATTDVVLRGLPTFYSYTFTDVSAGFFPAAKERFPDAARRMQFKTLDISSDPLAQGFEPESFDLIIAANVLHVTPKLGETLANVRKLLRPDGKFLLQEMYMTVKWLNFIMGLLPGWWLGDEDGRSQEPYVSPERWAEELQTAGFLAPEASVFDDEIPFQANVTMVASPDSAFKLKPAVYLLSGNPEGEVATNISASLQRFGLEVEKIRLSEEPRGPVISILDLEGKSFLQDITSAEFSLFKDFLSKLTADGMLWLTRPSQISCSDPQYAAILGLLRVVRNEMSIPLCTLELDDTTSPEAWQAIFNVYQKINRSRAVKQDEMADSDCEFAYIGGTIYLPRFHWISVTDELTSRPEVQRTFKRLEIGMRGSLKSLRWVEKPLDDNLVGEEVDVDIRAVGMNFKVCALLHPCFLCIILHHHPQPFADATLKYKDTLIAMGIVNGPKEAGNGFGVECSGVVRAVGPDVTDLSVGDRVMAITKDAYATMTRTMSSSCIKMPDDLTFEEGAGMPCVYPTVIHGLVNLARLEKGQTVLIQSACGGVGLAAIYVCQMIGVDKIYATVGSAEKVQYLVDTFNLPRSHIFHSRDASFLPGIMRKTDNRGVDVVLNSLSGELLHASVSDPGRRIIISSV